MTRFPSLRWSAWALLMIAVGGGVLTARLVADGNRALEQSDLAWNRGDVRAATLYAHRAAVLYVPGAGHVERGYARLRAIAKGAETARDLPQAEIAWRAVRAAALETAHLRVYHRELQEADRNLARLEGRPLESKTGQSDGDGGSGPGPRRSNNQAWSVLLGAGFTLLTVGVIGAVKRGVARDGTLALSEAKFAMLMLAFGATCWTLTLLYG